MGVGNWNDLPIDLFQSIQKILDPGSRGKKGYEFRKSRVQRDIYLSDRESIMYLLVPESSSPAN